MLNEKITKLQENALGVNDGILGKPLLTKDFVQENIIKKKILFVTRPIAPPWDEASKNFAYHLAINLTKINQNLEIHLMTKGELPELPNNIVQHPIYTSAENDFDFQQKIRSIFFQWGVKNKFDIVHYFFTPSKLNSWLIKNFLYPQKSKTIQTIATLREDLNSESEIKKLIFGDIAIAYSNYTTKKLKQFGFNNAQHIYPGIDFDIYQYRPKNTTFLSELNLKDKDFVINFVGEYVRLGGIDNVIASFLNLVNQIPNPKLLLSLRIKNEKDAFKKQKIKKELQEKNILDKIIFADEINFSQWNMSHLYNLADIVLFPVHNMSGKFDIPLTIPEAMACQKPVILSDIPILREFANHNNAIIIQKNDTTKLTEAILDLYNNPKKREEIANNGMHYVRRNFNIEFIAEKYNDLYDKL